MRFLIVGLGNIGEEYDSTRHNVGRSMVDYFVANNDFSDWKKSKIAKALEANAKIGKHTVIAITPELYMNQSGKALAPYVKSAKDAERLIVVYDDMDLPIGSIRISFGRSSGGHNGVESIIKNIKTKDFVRIRVGVSPETAKGGARKPKGEEAVIKFLMGKLREAEIDIYKKLRKKIAEAITTIIEDGREKAMGEFN
jgi:PTH1 family peptidyl-tRNA hydrolase